MAKKTNSYLYVHRLMRLFNYLHSIKIKGKGKQEFWARTSMMCALLSYGYSEKLPLEAGILSYIPQFTKLDKKTVTRLFGPDVRELIAEVDDLRDTFVACSEENEIDANLLKGYSIYAKNIYLHQCYVDTVMAFSTDKGIQIDGIEYPVKGEKIKVGDEWYERQDFDQYWLDMLKWKIDTLEYCNSDIRQAILEVCKQYKVQKGFEFNIKDYKFLQASEDQTPAETGVVE